MPYIKQENRQDTKLDHPGNLNYLITKLMAQYVKENGLNYRTINDVVGVLTCAKDEFYRRVVVPYEDSKIEENGDVEQYLDILKETK